MKEDVMFYIGVGTFIGGILTWAYKSYFMMIDTKETLKVVQETLEVIKKDLQLREITEARTEERIKSLFENVKELSERILKIENKEK